jgi:hypothetical protein
MLLLIIIIAGAVLIVPDRGNGRQVRSALGNGNGGDLYRECRHSASLLQSGQRHCPELRRDVCLDDDRSAMSRQASRIAI